MWYTICLYHGTHLLSGKSRNLPEGVCCLWCYMYFMRIRSKPGLDSLDVTNIDHLHTSFPKASLASVPPGRDFNRDTYCNTGRLIIITNAGSCWIFSLQIAFFTNFSATAPDFLVFCESQPWFIFPCSRYNIVSFFVLYCVRLAVLPSPNRRHHRFCCFLPVPFVFFLSYRLVWFGLLLRGLVSIQFVLYRFVSFRFVSRFSFLVSLFSFRVSARFVLVICRSFCSVSFRFV